MIIKQIIKYIILFIIEIIEKIEWRKKDLDQDDVDKKILNTISNLDIDVWSDTGWVKATDIHITQPYKLYTIFLENGYYIECADNHILFDQNYKEVFCKNLQINDYLQTDIGISKVIKIQKTNRSLSMFDLSIDSKNHRYYTNGILSHNTVNSAITILHFITFNNDKNVMIVANIAATTIEIIDKIKSIYTLLPFFLKKGIKNWTQKAIVFDNGCKIKSAARSKTPAIGFTIDLLFMDEFAHIPSTILEPYYQAAYPTVTAMNNSKIIITSTPNGMNLFYRLLTDAERLEEDPLKTTYKALRVYWHQVEGRFVTYYRLNNHKMFKYNITKEEIYSQVEEFFKDKTKVSIDYFSDVQKDVISVYNNLSCDESITKSFQYKNREGMLIPIQMVSDVTTWKDEAIKNIGGEDAFNQEYGLRFVNASRSLLSESLLENIMKDKVNFIHRELEELNRLKFTYNELKWVEDLDIFDPINKKRINGIMSIDISEGLAQDFSVINIFQIKQKPKETIELQKSTYINISDFYQLEQIGIYRCNLISVKQLAELFYLIAFEYFNPENFKVVLEINTYGNEFLAYLPNVFDGNNDYGSSIFFRYKQRADSDEEKIGLKLGENKNSIVVKDYQDNMNKYNFVIRNEDNIREITTFVKQVTPSGNVRYASDSGKDDSCMTVVNASTVFSMYRYKEMVDSYSKLISSSEDILYFNSILSISDYIEGNNYSALLNVRKRKAKEYNPYDIMYESPYQKYNARK